MDLIRIGTFELRPSERMLCNAGKPVELGARAFDLLLVLVESSGRLVTKSTLLERVWPRLVVDENNIPAQIAILRRVLGAGAIRTVPGFGYRLELEVAHADSNDDVAAAPAVSSEPATQSFTIPRRAWPDRLAPLVGREEDVRNVQRALEGSSLVTIVGIAGVGKTRLAQEVLVRESSKPNAAVAWVSLGPLDDVSHVPSAIAVALGLALTDAFDGFAALRQALERVSVLLIMDCAEHLVNGLARPMMELISQTQGVRALITSQAPLNISGETVYRLTALAVPEAGASAADAVQCAAVALFAQRAAAADRRFELSTLNTPIIAQICRSLDGIPLALELAAARVPTLGLGAILERLDDRFRLLKPTGPQADPRHSTLHTAFDWSYGLLNAAEQRVFNRLGTFATSFSLEAGARCVADETIDTAEAEDLIGRLVERSLISCLEGDPARYTLLETARFYALGKLAGTGGLEAARERMAVAMLELLDVAYQEYWSLDEAIWLHRYEPDLGNVRAAMEWAAMNDRELGVALFGSAWPLFVETDLYAEGRARYSQAITLLSDGMPRARIGRLWEAIATYDSTRQCDRARYAAELAATMYAETNTRSRYYALMQLALNLRTDTEAARLAFDTAHKLEDPAWPPRLLSHGALTEGALLMNAGQFDEARVAYQRAMKFALTTSERQALAASVSIVELDIARGDTAAALQLGRPLALSLRHLGRRETLFDLLVMTFSALLLAGETDEARATGAELYDLAMRLDTSKLYTVLDAMSLLACEGRCYEAAARISICADVSHEAHGQSRRRPAEERAHSVVMRVLEEKLGADWRGSIKDSRDPMDEATACALALGFCA